MSDSSELKLLLQKGFWGSVPCNDNDECTCQKNQSARAGNELMQDGLSLNTSGK